MDEVRFECQMCGSVFEPTANAFLEVSFYAEGEMPDEEESDGAICLCPRCQRALFDT